MKINLKNFETVLKKATHNFNIETVQLVFEDGRIKTSMVSSSNNNIAILDITNKVVDVNDEMVFNFIEPSSNVLPFISSFDSEEVNFSITDAFMKLKDGDQSCRINFCDNEAVNVLGRQGTKDGLDWFFKIKIDESFMDKFEKIKKIGSRFGKVYIEVKDGNIYLDTSDKENYYSNGLKFKLDEIESDEKTICFYYKDMVHLMSIIDLDLNFELRCAYMDTQKLGLLNMVTENETENENYSLISIKI